MKSNLFIRSVALGMAVSLTAQPTASAMRNAQCVARHALRDTRYEPPAFMSQALAETSGLAGNEQLLAETDPKGKIYRALTPAAAPHLDSFPMPAREEVIYDPAPLVFSASETMGERRQKHLGVLQDLPVSWANPLVYDRAQFTPEFGHRLDAVLFEMLPGSEGLADPDNQLRDMILGESVSEMIYELMKNSSNAVVGGGAAQGETRLKIYRKADQVIIDVSDNGVGIKGFDQLGRPVPNREASIVERDKIEGGSRIGVLWAALVAQVRGGRLEYVSDDPTLRYRTTARIILPESAVTVSKLPKQTLGAQSHPPAGAPRRPYFWRVTDRTFDEAFKLQIRKTGAEAIRLAREAVDAGAARHVITTDEEDSRLDILVAAADGYLVHFHYESGPGALAWIDPSALDAGQVQLSGLMSEDHLWHIVPMDEVSKEAVDWFLPRAEYDLAPHVRALQAAVQELRAGRPPTHYLSEYVDSHGRRLCVYNVESAPLENATHRKNLRPAGQNPGPATTPEAFDRLVRPRVDQISSRILDAGAPDVIVSFPIVKHPNIRSLVSKAKIELEGIGKTAVLVVLCDVEHQDGLAEVPEQWTGAVKVVHLVKPPPEEFDQGTPGLNRRAWSMRAAALVASRLGTHWINIDADVANPEGLDTGILQAMGDGADYVATHAKRRIDTDDGALEWFVFLLVGALFGVRIHELEAGEFGVSKRFVSSILSDAKIRYDPVYAVENQFALKALSEGLPVAEVQYAEKKHDPVDAQQVLEKRLPALGQILFDELAVHLDHLPPASRSLSRVTVSEFPHDQQTPGSHNAEYKSLLLECFRTAYQQARPIYQSEKALQPVREFLDLLEGLKGGQPTVNEYVLPPELWAKATFTLLGEYVKSRDGARKIALAQACVPLCEAGILGLLNRGAKVPAAQLEKEYIGPFQEAGRHFLPAAARPAPQDAVVDPVRTISLRRAVAADLPGMLSLRQQVRVPWWWPKRQSERMFQQLFQQFLNHRKGILILVVEVDGKLAGMVIADQSAFYSGQVEISDLVIDVASRGRRVGLQLLWEVVRQVRTWPEVRKVVGWDGTNGSYVRVMKKYGLRVKRYWRRVHLDLHQPKLEGLLSRHA